jgi:hypothetical protein
MSGPEASDATPTSFDWTVRTRIYETFANTGRAPALPEVAGAVGGTEHQVRASLQRLHAAHEIAPQPDGDGVWMANPFSAVPTDYQVETGSMTCFANCAFDALGVPAILGIDGWTRTHCAESGTPLEFGVRNGGLEGDDGVIHLVTPLRDAWVDIGFTWANYLAFRSEGDVDAWLARTGHPRGAVVTNAQMWALVQPWYAGRLSPEWRGRSVGDAQAILDQVGLQGDFWKLGWLDEGLQACEDSRVRFVSLLQTFE